jgi:hypothetical protein
MFAMSLGWLGPVAVGISFEHGGSTTTILILAGWTLIPAAIATLAPGVRGNLPHPLPIANQREDGGSQR